MRPEHFGADGTGTGRGVVAILQREWSPRIQVVEFGGAPTKRPSGSGPDARPCDEEYRWFVTELWFSFRLFVEGDQIRGLDAVALKEFCIREYEVVGDGKYQLESKTDMKKRTNGVSPDEADACVVLTEVVRRNGINPQLMGAGALEDDSGTHWKELREQSAALDFDAHPDCYMDGSL